MLCTIQSAVPHGVTGHPVTVEAFITNGLPGYNVIGLDNGTARESRDRIRAAILTSGHSWPQRNITINVAPNGRKIGAGAVLDLPIALAILGASQQLNQDHLTDYGALGELGLDGSIRPVAAIAALTEAVNTNLVVTCSDNARIGQLLNPHKVVVADSLADAATAIQQQAPFTEPEPISAHHTPSTTTTLAVEPAARRAIEIAAAGGHHTIITGPTGTGKTVLANAIGDLLPDLNTPQREAVIRAHSAAGTPITPTTITRPPVRKPHPSCSAISMIGGGTRNLRPGEVAIAHQGVLQLDNLTEYPTPVLDALRQPMDDQTLRVARCNDTANYPAAIMVIATLTPCPCGHPLNVCTCSTTARARHNQRLHSALHARFAIQITTTNDTINHKHTQPTTTTAQRVANTRHHTQKRSHNTTANAHHTPDQLNTIAPLSTEAAHLLDQHVTQGHLSTRGRHHVHAVALTITDLDNPGNPISTEAITEAIALHPTPTKAR